MALFGFLLFSTGLNLVLGLMVQVRGTYGRTLRFILAGLSLLFTLHVWVGYAAIDFMDPSQRLWSLKGTLAVDLMAGLLLMELARRFLRPNGEPADWSIAHPRLSLVQAAQIATVTALIPLFLLDNPRGLAPEGLLGYAWLLTLSMPLVNAVLCLYFLENTYRFAQEYQRRIGRLTFIGLFWLAGFHVLAFGRALLYGELHPYYAEASSVVYGVVFPVVLLGFLRYRLGSERVDIPRDTITTSVTVFMIGAAFLGVAATVMIFRALHLDFNHFETYLIGFSLCFLAVIALGSGTMRRRITRFVNARFYSRKYDYHDQFFRLHHTLASEGNIERAVTDLVENMKYSVAVDDAHCFLLDAQDGNFYAQRNKEYSDRADRSLSGDSPLVRAFLQNPKPIDFKKMELEGQAFEVWVAQEALIAEMGIDAAFPIFVGGELAGVLALQGGSREPLDAEDLALIQAFAASIGDVVFKSRAQQSRIEQKQFESFNHVASFIIHDIKNQVATLSLLTHNAERNLQNPAFQTSMMTSIKSCTAALQGLVNKLATSPTQIENQILIPHPLRPLLDEVIQNSGLVPHGELAFTLQALDGAGSIADRELDQCVAPMEKQSLFFVLKNLVTNAIEAMQGKGQIDFSYGTLSRGIPRQIRDLLGGSERLFQGFGAFIVVTDHGPGMDAHFLRTRLFQPFATTKEKGVGIGLYQCRNLMEKMGGKIFCRSEKGKGTSFCLLLPEVKQDNGYSYTPTTA